jgi:hypothetical protein
MLALRSPDGAWLEFVESVDERRRRGRASVNPFQENNMSSLASVTQWHHEVDVLICGFGMAGSSAAIEAIEADPERRACMIIEKMPSAMPAATRALRASR